VLHRGGVASGPDRTLVEACDRTRRACVRSHVTYADVEAFELGAQRQKGRTLACVQLGWI
jgi:hypothetical protein